MRHKTLLSMLLASAAALACLAHAGRPVRAGDAYASAGPSSPAADLAAPRINPPYVAAVRPGTPLLWTVPVSGARPLAFSAAGLPDGAAINAATGTITGVVARGGDYSVTVTARNDHGSDSHTVHLVVGKRLALTPPMGWNSYDSYGDNVTEAEVLANARVVSRTMQPFGWDTVVVDFRWYDPGAFKNHVQSRAGAALTIDDYGRLLPAPNRFPSAAGGLGFAPLAAKLHAMGLRFGIHVMRGIPRNALKADLPIFNSGYKASDAADTSDLCPWSPDMYGVRGDTPAGRAYYDSLLRLYASWGVDYLKVDDMSRPYHQDEIEALRAAIDRCGRSIVLSLSPGATPLAARKHVAAHANMWREQDDFWDNWPEVASEFPVGQSWRGVVGPGHWGDADMLPFGRLSVDGRSVGPERETKLTRPEQMTVMSLWSLLPSPLMVGADLPGSDSWTTSLLTDPEVLAVDQDALGAAGERVESQGDTQVWRRRLGNGSLAVGLFNLGAMPRRVTAHWDALGLSGHYSVRDLWLKETVGVCSGEYGAMVPSHGVELVTFRKL